MTEPPDNPSREHRFPPEEEWLDLPCSEVTPGFVDRTWAMVQRDRAAAARAEGADELELPRELLEVHRVPPPSPGFVESTWAHIRAARSATWQRVLAGQEVPEPTPDFVNRVLAALREQRPVPVAVQAPPARRGRWLAAAALLLAATAGVFWLGGADDPSLPFEVLSARTFSADPWALALSSLQDRGLGVAVDDATLRFAELAGLEVRR